LFSTYNYYGENKLCALKTSISACQNTADYFALLENLAQQKNQYKYISMYALLNDIYTAIKQKITLTDEQALKLIKLKGNSYESDSTLPLTNLWL